MLELGDLIDSRKLAFPARLEGPSQAVGGAARWQIPVVEPVACSLAATVIRLGHEMPCLHALQEVIKLVEAVSQLRASKGLRGGVNSALGLLLGSGMWPMRR